MYTLYKGKSQEHTISIAYDKSTDKTYLIPIGDSEFGSNIYEYKNGVRKKTIDKNEKAIEVLSKSNRSNIKKVDLFDSIGMIDGSAFVGCSNISSVTYKNTNYTDKDSLICALLEDGIECDINAFDATDLNDLATFTILYTSTDEQIVIPENTDDFGAKITTNNYIMNQGKITFDGLINCIPDGAFTYIQTLQSIIIPEGVTRIGRGAFHFCTQLESVTIPSGVTKIDNEAFSTCSCLESIGIPTSVTSIGRLAFNNCSSLTSISIPEGVTTIEGGTFSYCKSLTSITIPESVTSIGREAFSDCYSLTTVTIPEGVATINVGTFYGCRSLECITIPSSVTSIFSEAFYGCTGLKCIIIPGCFNSFTDISSDAFEGCLVKSVIYNDIEYTTYNDLKRAFEANYVRDNTSKAFENIFDTSPLPPEGPIQGSEIVYISTDGEVIVPKVISKETWGAELISNVYEETID